MHRFWLRGLPFPLVFQLLKSLSLLLTSLYECPSYLLCPERKETRPPNATPPLANQWGARLPWDSSLLTVTGDAHTAGISLCIQQAGLPSSGHRGELSLPAPLRLGRGYDSFWLRIAAEVT